MQGGKAPGNSGYSVFVRSFVRYGRCIVTTDDKGAISVYHCRSDFNHSWENR